jgi:hypothetical protein
MWKVTETSGGVKRWQQIPPVKAPTPVNAPTHEDAAARKQHQNQQTFGGYDIYAV